MARFDVVDRILSISAIVAAIAAVAVAVYEARIGREHQKVSVWPYLNQFNTLAPGLPYTRNIQNVGIGPALVRSVQVRVDGRPVQRWSEIVRALTGREAPDLIYSSLHRGSVILPGSTLELLRLPPGETATRFWQAVQTDRFSMRVCYCSLYQDCWISDNQQDEPQSVRQCRTDAQVEFSQ